MYELFEKLLNERGVTAYRVSKETGIGASTFTDWKNGRSDPKIDKLQKIADYFQVDVTYFTGKNKEERYYSNDETAEIAQEIFENKELRLLFDAAKDAQPEDLQTVHQMLLALKRRERGDID